MKGVEPLSSGLQDRRSGIQLSYIAEVAQTSVCDSSNQAPTYRARSQTEVCATNLVELRGVEPLRPACKAGIIPLDHSPENWSRRRESNPHPFVYETNALPHELLRKNESVH